MRASYRYWPQLPARLPAVSGVLTTTENSSIDEGKDEGSMSKVASWCGLALPLLMLGWGGCGEGIPGDLGAPHAEEGTVDGDAGLLADDDDPKPFSPGASEPAAAMEDDSIGDDSLSVSGGVAYQAEDAARSKALIE